MPTKETPEGFPACRPHPISQAEQAYNDPPLDSLFRLLSESTNRCTICGAVVYNNTESRDAHLSEKGCHAH
jgi:hypothetical protein